MAKFKTTMSGDKFKKAVSHLPDDPTQGEEFLAFRATKDGDKENTYVGLYVGPNMKSDFGKDKGAYKAPTLFKGTLRRSAKHPAKKLILESTGALPPLKELGKECLKATKLPLVIVAIKPGEPEPEPTHEELAELGLPATAATATQPKAVTPPRPTAAPSRPTTPPRPTAPVPRATAPVPTPSKAPDQATGSELAQFKARLKNLMGPIRDANTFNSEIGVKTAEANNCSHTDPVKALRLLDEIEADLEKIGKKKENEIPLKAAKVLRETWDEVAKAGLETDSILTARRTAVLDALKKKDVKGALKAIQSLKEQLAAVTAARDESRRQLASRWLLRNLEDPNLPLPQHMLANEAQLWSEKTAKFAKEFQVPEETARELLTSALADMKEKGGALNPGGAVINPIIPNESRPKLTRQEVIDATSYVGGHFANVNPSLWEGKTPPSPFDELHKNLQEAFKKTKPLPNPIRVTRGLNFENAAELNAYLQPFKNAAGTDKLVPLLGYISTGTAGTPPLFKGNIEFTIIAKQGLDMTPYTGAGNAMSKEKELCLNHGTLVKVHRVKAMKGGVWHVQVEQILPSGNA